MHTNWDSVIHFAKSCDCNSIFSRMVAYFNREEWVSIMDCPWIGLVTGASTDTLTDESSQVSSMDGPWIRA